MNNNLFLKVTDDNRNLCTWSLISKDLSIPVANLEGSKSTYSEYVAEAILSQNCAKKTTDEIINYLSQTYPGLEVEPNWKQSVAQVLSVNDFFVASDVENAIKPAADNTESAESKQNDASQSYWRLAEKAIVKRRSSTKTSSYSQTRKAPVGELAENVSETVEEDCKPEAVAEGSAVHNILTSSPKPNLTYAVLIAQAIESTEEKQLSLNQIYTYFMEKHEYFRNAGQGWKVS
jgi:Forkhead domain